MGWSKYLSDRGQSSAETWKEQHWRSANRRQRAKKFLLESALELAQAPKRNLRPCWCQPQCYQSSAPRRWRPELQKTTTLRSCDVPFWIYPFLSAKKF